jgi:hypothetical protein
MKGFYQAYATIVIALGVCCVWLASLVQNNEMPADFHTWKWIAFFFILGLVLISMTSRLPGAGRRSATAFFAPVLLMGPAIATVMATIANLFYVAFIVFGEAIRQHKANINAGTASGDQLLLTQVEEGPSLLAHLVDIAQASISIMCAGIVYFALGGKVGNMGIPSDLPAAVAAGTCMFLMEVTLAEIATALKRNHPLLATWRNGLIYSLPVAGALIGLGLLLVLVLLPPFHMDATVLIMLIPCWLLYYSFRVYLDMRHAYERTLRTLAGLVEAKLQSPSQIQRSLSDGGGVSALGAKARQIEKWAGALAEHMGVPQKDLQLIRFAAYLLNVGKIGLPRNLLTRSSFASPRQRKAYQNHVVLANQILAPVEFLRPVGQIILHHQERYDGLGGPLGLRGEAIPLGSRILAVALAFVEAQADILTDQPQGVDYALEQVTTGSGTSFDPKIIIELRKLLVQEDFIEDSKNLRGSSSGVLPVTGLIGKV